MPGTSSNRCDFGELVGKRFIQIERILEDHGNEILRFITTDGVVYEMNHEQDCSELVYLAEVVGDLKDLLCGNILKATEDTNAETPVRLEECPNIYMDDSVDYEWTFYNIATHLGHVTLRWYGTSNGYYSLAVSLHKIEEGNEYGWKQELEPA